MEQNQHVRTTPELQYFLGRPAASPLSKSASHRCKNFIQQEGCRVNSNPRKLVIPNAALLLVQATSPSWYI
jgi:hypothetical protein